MSNSLEAINSCDLYIAIDTVGIKGTPYSRLHDFACINVQNFSSLENLNCGVCQEEIDKLDMFILVCNYTAVLGV